MPKKLKIWLSERMAAERLGISRSSMRRIAEMKGLSQRRLPGLNRIEYRAEEIDRIDRESVTTAELEASDRAPRVLPSGEAS